MTSHDKKQRYGGFFEISERVGMRERYSLAERMTDVTRFLRKSGNTDRELMLAYFNEIVELATNRRTMGDNGIEVIEERSMSEAYVVLCGFYWQVLRMIRKLEELGQLQVMQTLPTENPLASDPDARAAFAAHLPKAEANAPDVCDYDRSTLHI